MEVYVLALQARTLRWVGLGWIVIGLWLGCDPTTVAWRAAIGAVIAMIIAGWLMRRVVAVIEERVAADMAERLLAAEQATAMAVAKPGQGPGRPAGRAERKGRAA
jgi:hypothetical protein